jgi:hypothetical protein
MIYVRSTIVGFVTMLVICWLTAVAIAIRQASSVRSHGNEAMVGILIPMKPVAWIHIFHHHPVLLIASFLGFAAGFFLAYRAYSRPLAGNPVDFR